MKRKQNKKFTSKKSIAVVIPILLCILVLFSINSSGFSKNEIDTQIDNWNNLKSITYDDLKNSIPTFTTITTTVYHTASLEDFNNNWCSPTKGSCFTIADILPFYNNDPAKRTCLNNNMGFCCIKNKDRGFYEDVKCQGSGVANGKTYNTYGIKTTIEESEPLPSEFPSGKTATGTNPEKKRTVAVNPKANTNCYIPYWTKMYIYFGEGKDEWNGVYMAEDTGSAFGAQCKIDIYTGVGKESANIAARYVDSTTSENPKIYLLDDNGKVIPPDGVFGEGYASDKGLSSVVGTLFVKYANIYEEKGLSTLYDETYKIAKQVSDTCTIGAYPDIDERELCMYDIILNAENSGITIDEGDNCVEEGLPPYTIREIMPDWEYADVFGVISKEPVSEMRKVGDEEKKIIILQISGEDDSITIHLWNSSTELEDKLKVGEYVLIKDAFRVNYQTRLAHLKEQIIINPDAVKMKAIKSIATKLADCSTSEEDCLCETDYKGRLENLKLRENTISFGNFEKSTSVDVSIPLLIMGDEYSLDLADENGKLLFEKYDKGFIRVKENTKNLPVCVPKQKYYLMCSELIQDKVPVNHDIRPELRVEPKYLPPMRFTLKI